MTTEKICCASTTIPIITVNDLLRDDGGRMINAGRRRPGTDSGDG
ncbi:hypothetical protein V7x_08270 [Crateriforma conspicua]|uniref:Uncharacterized protein n=1 Tax=Crateriforma conspicua TaxID=2527996 RepID=A0A5C6FSG5_9PLAN|nr:hypothetical protein V7x_08270 [Crateriforma conspicua]